jgi:radical SAM-linked protein
VTTSTSPEDKIVRIRITFAKTAAMRYTSTLDLHKTWERTMRRANLPIVYSQGFNRRPRINLASALPLGMTSDCEVLDVQLRAGLSTDEIAQSLAATVPPGIKLIDVDEVPPSMPSLQSQLCAAEYVITLGEDIDNIEQRVNSLRDAEDLLRTRRGKEYDLRPLIEKLTVDQMNEELEQQLSVRLSAREGATGRPEELILALGADPMNARYHRTRLIFSS